MAAKYILIDFENVQSDKLETLDRTAYKIKIFVGARQSRVAFSLASALQPMGKAVEYIQIEGSGRNALDMHIAYYIGRLSAEEPGSVFHIISKDTDYDPLIDHLRKLGITCDRSSAIADLVKTPVAKAPASAKRAPRASPAKAPKAAAAPTPAAPDLLDELRANLLKRGTAVPSRLDTLTSTIKSIFKTRISDKGVGDLIDRAQQRGWIAVANGKVTYHLTKK